MKKLTGLDKALIFVAIFVALFTITMIVTFWFKEDVPNVLITAVFGATFAECGFCSYIWKHKVSKEKGEENESGIIEDVDRIGNNNSDFGIVISSDTVPK